jgi:phosphate transport system protein
MPHILHEFDNAMANLKSQVLTMASLTRQNLERSVQALLARDIDLSRTVIGEDTEVDELEVKIDHIGMEILLRFHPVASDLRFVITSMKMAHNLERISDHAVNIAKRAKKLCKSGGPLESGMIEPLYAKADQLLRDALFCYTDGNTDLGEHLKKSDEALDKAHKEVISLLSSRLETAGPGAENLLHLIFVSRSIERIGDLAVNIGEDAVFMNEARDIRHEHRKNPDDTEGATDQAT